jgi:hypothetical protein
MIDNTRARLKEWGKWASGGYPIIGSMFRSLFGRGGPSGEMPKHIQEVDVVICRAEAQDRCVLIAYYCQGGSFRQKALALEIDRTTLKRRLDRAEWYVNAALDGFEPPKVVSDSECGFHR